MNREISMPNRICGYHQIKRAWQIHQSKLIHLKPSIDLQPPKKYIFEKKKHLNGSISSKRFREIEQENQILLNKLTKPFRDSSHFGDSMEFSHITNQRHRQLFNKVINSENSQLVKRIKEKKSNYDVRSYMKDRQNVEKYINLRSRFPYKDMPKNKTNIKFWMKNSSEKYVKLPLTESNMTERITKLREIRTEKQFQGKLYLIEGIITSNKICIQIKNKYIGDERHDIELELNAGIQIINKHFNNDFRAMVNAIDYNVKDRIFYMKLPSHQ